MWPHPRIDSGVILFITLLLIGFAVWHADSPRWRRRNNELAAVWAVIVLLLAALVVAVVIVLAAGEPL